MARHLTKLVLSVLLLSMTATALRADDWSPEYQASLRREVERRRQRRANQPKPGPGVIGMYPMPPVLIIRQTPETHREIQQLLDLLRR